MTDSGFVKLLRIKEVREVSPETVESLRLLKMFTRLSSNQRRDIIERLEIPEWLSTNPQRDRRNWTIDRTRLGRVAAANTAYIVVVAPRSPQSSVGEDEGSTGHLELGVSLGLSG